MCQNPLFRLRLGTAEPEDLCLIYLGAADFGGGGGETAGLEETGGDPYFVLRRWYEGRAAAVTLRVDWEGIFTLLSNDDEHAEEVFEDVIAAGAPEDVDRRWSDEPSTLQMYSNLLLVG